MHQFWFIFISTKMHLIGYLVTILFGLDLFLRKNKMRNWATIVHNSIPSHLPCSAALLNLSTDTALDTRYSVWIFVEIKSRNLPSSDSTEQVGRSDKQKPGHDNKLPDSCFLLMQLLPDKLWMVTWRWIQWMPISYSFRILEFSDGNWNRKIIMLC